MEIKTTNYQIELDSPEAISSSVNKIETILTDQLSDEAKIKLWQFLAELGILGNQSEEVDSIAEITVKKIANLLAADHAIIAGQDRLGRNQIVASVGFAPDFSLQDSHTLNKLVERAIASEQPIFIPASEQIDPTAAVEAGYGDPTPSILCAPFNSDDSFTGAIYLEKLNSSGGFDKNDFRLFLAIIEWLGNLSSISLSSNRSSVNSSISQIEMDQFPGGLILLNNQAEIKGMNPIAMEVLDVNRDSLKLVGKSEKPTTLWDVLPEKELTRWQYLITMAQTGVESHWEPQLVLDTGYMEKTLSVRLAPISGRHGTEDGLVISINDITDQTVRDDYIMISEKLAARGELANQVAAGLSKNLSTLKGSLSNLSEQIDNNDQKKSKFSYNNAASALLKLELYVDSLADLSRPDTHFISYNIKDLIEDVLFANKNRVKFKTVHFTIEMENDIPNFEIDVAQIQELIKELLDNAAFSTEERAILEEDKDSDYQRKISISVSYDESNDTILLEVQDNGVGIENDETERIFLLHYSTKKNGHGIGLFNCRNIMLQHHGRIMAESTDGQGCKLTLTLPRFQPRIENKKD